MSNILEDEKLLAFRKAFDNGEFSMNTEKYMDEIKNIHITRSIRTLSSSQIQKDINTVIDAILQNQANRSRIVEIKMLCTRLVTKVGFRKDALINYIKVKYREELKTLGRTQADKNAYIEELFSFTNTSSSQLQTLQNFCDLVISDIDTAGWSLKSVIDCLKITDIANKIVT